MVIACLGWGSLIWDPRELPIQRYWFDDGPLIPVEFTRQSNDGRLTLVVTEGAGPVRSLWSIMDCTDVVSAAEALGRRERTDKRDAAGNLAHIGAWSVGDGVPAGIPTLSYWAQVRGVDAVVWTALPAQFGGVEVTPCVEDVITYLRSLRGTARDAAERYIRRAPRQVDTVYRRAIEAELGWHPDSA